MNEYCVITTINHPTKAVQEWHKWFGENLIIVGDEKTPKDWNYNGVNPIASISRMYAPDNHYARKNIGYLRAIKQGATLIYDTDDDNTPKEKWNIRKQEVDGMKPSKEGWFNVYREFSHDDIWPRGFSLKEIKNRQPILISSRIKESSIQQGLADGEPDIDAVCRLTVKYNGKFHEDGTVVLGKNQWCPFNSQSTWWFPKAFPLMYLPVTVSFRMTDIWRGFVAQRCLWELGEGVAFHSPAEVFQDRNEHDLLKDLEDEVSGYLKNDKIVEILSSLTLKSGSENVCDNMLTCYNALIGNGIMHSFEMMSLKDWINDYGNAIGNIQ